MDDDGQLPLWHRHDLGTERLAALRAWDYASDLRGLALTMLIDAEHHGLTAGEFVAEVQRRGIHKPEHGVRPRLTELTMERWNERAVKTVHRRINRRHNPEAAYVLRDFTQPCCYKRREG